MNPSTDPNAGRIGHLNPEQDQALNNLRSYLVEKGIEVPGNPPIADDVSLIRFLRARKFDLEKTKLMFDNYLKWREEIGIDDLRENFDFPEWREVQRVWPQYFHKVDKEGRPIYYQHWDLSLPELYKVTTRENLSKWMVLNAERASTYVRPGCDKGPERTVYQGIAVMNMKNCSVSQIWALREPMRESIKWAQDCFPETAAAIFVINAPYLFTAIWGLVRPWLDEVTAAKVEIHGSDFLPALLSKVNSSDDLPRNLGGTCTDCEDCRTSDMGPWNPDGKGGLGWEKKMRAKLGETDMAEDKEQTRNEDISPHDRAMDIEKLIDEASSQVKPEPEALIASA